MFNASAGQGVRPDTGAPAVIGVLMIDTAVKAANVQVVGYGSPTKNTSFSNEVMIWVKR